MIFETPGTGMFLAIHELFQAFLELFGAFVHPGKEFHGLVGVHAVTAFNAQIIYCTSPAAFGR